MAAVWWYLQRITGALLVILLVMHFSVLEEMSIIRPTALAESMYLPLTTDIPSI